ncbi:MAG: hypothetical protein HRT45_15945 [Bdellovibrionales bacterium]|nr:hypothetical protein [Bdellovibrionales bacterium]
MNQVLVYLKAVLLFLASLYATSALANQPTCGTHVVLDVSQNIMLARDTSSCDESFDKEEFIEEYRQKLVDGLPAQCHSKFMDAIQCCLYPEHEACTQQVSRPAVMIMTTGTQSTTDLIRTAIRENVNGQNIASARAEACRLARTECSSTCLDEIQPQAAILCEKLADPEHCEKRIANVHLNAACQSMRPLNRAVAAESDQGFLSVSCHVQGVDAIMCNGY